jgi:hypothetical protein
MRKRFAIIGCIVTLALLLLSSTSIAFAKDLSDFRYRDCSSNFEVGYDNDERPQPQILLMNFANAHSPSSSLHPHTYQACYHGPYGHWHTSALNDKGKFQESLQLNYTNDTCRMNFSNEGNTPVNITYNVSVSSNHHLSGCQGKLALGAGESREISEPIPVKKDWRNFAFKSEMKMDSSSTGIGDGGRTSMAFKVISWHSVSFRPVPNDPGEVDKDI